MPRKVGKVRKRLKKKIRKENDHFYGHVETQIEKVQQQDDEIMDLLNEIFDGTEKFFPFSMIFAENKSKFFI